MKLAAHGRVQKELARRALDHARDPSACCAGQSCVHAKGDVLATQREGDVLVGPGLVAKDKLLIDVSAHGKPADHRGVGSKLAIRRPCVEHEDLARRSVEGARAL